MTNIDPTEAHAIIGELNNIAQEDQLLPDHDLAAIKRSAELLEDAAEIEYGKRVMESEISGNTYRVTAWVETGDGQFIALEKELISEGQADV